VYHPGKSDEREGAFCAQRPYQLIEVKFGSYPQDVVVSGKHIGTGGPISWHPDEVLAGEKVVESESGQPLRITWETASLDSGWCKLDWVVADTAHGHLINASNMLDEYVTALEKEVKKYITKSVNYGKAARRMYNIFRLTGEYEVAAYIRELFDEPSTILYQVWSLIRTMDDCFVEGTSITIEQLLKHTDQLIMDVVDTLEGGEETEVVRLLLRLRDILSHEQTGQALSPQAEAARAELINIVNNFFYEKLTAIPTIKGYMDAMAE
jgi:hypothetical protein